MNPEVYPLLVIVTLLAFIPKETTGAMHEKDEFRIYDRSFKASNSQMVRMLARANLEARGFTKVLTSHVISNRDTKSTELRQDVHFTKDVPCSQLSAVEREVRSLLPGVWDEGVTSKVHKIVREKSLKSEQICKAGIEIHFPRAGCGSLAGNPENARGDLAEDKRRESRLYTRDSKCPAWCLVCFMATSEI
ncbi:uncharacterized protein LOC116603275 [Nematostella vectensis]|uniref:uncharacterized protein LOC116603275 n=1 Tax=Nematostella vectensis TaxID=45351 RepID=UPI00138FB8A2|nr:uncharacterized protein LOC116603275 [Nematostella vectensis]